jgi:exodeoxyribonuclease VII small subunit
VSDRTNSADEYSTVFSSPKKGKKSSRSTSLQTTTLQNEWRYEATVKKIEAAIARIESGELDLVDVFSQFSEAIEDLRLCETFLSDRQQQVDLLIETLNEGE